MEHVATGFVVQPWEIVAAGIGLLTFAFGVTITGFSVLFTFMNNRFDKLDKAINDTISQNTKEHSEMNAEIAKNAGEISVLHERTGKHKHGH